MSLRRAYHRHFGYHGRFHVAVLFTIFVVAYVVVPRVARFLESIADYNPTGYEPKDLDRQRWLPEPNPSAIGGLDWDTIVGIALVLLVGVVWLTFVPARASRQRTPPR